MDMLHIKALEVHTTIGVYAWEQQIKQKLFIDIELPLVSSACEENINNTVDYAALCQGVTTLVESQSFVLVETVVQMVGQYILNTFAPAYVKVSISKPGAVANAGNIQISATLKFPSATNDNSGAS